MALFSFLLLACSAKNIHWHNDFRMAQDGGLCAALLTLAQTAPTLPLRDEAYTQAALCEINQHRDSLAWQHASHLSEQSNDLKASIHWAILRRDQDQLPAHAQRAYALDIIALAPDASAAHHALALLQNDCTQKSPPDTDALQAALLRLQNQTPEQQQMACRIHRAIYDCQEKVESTPARIDETVLTKCQSTDHYPALLFQMARFELHHCQCEAAKSRLQFLAQAANDDWLLNLGVHRYVDRARHALAHAVPQCYAQCQPGGTSLGGTSSPEPPAMLTHRRGGLSLLPLDKKHCPFKFSEGDVGKANRGNVSLMSGVVAVTLRGSFLWTSIAFPDRGF